MISCVDFASDCDCEECYSPHYQGKWYLHEYSIPIFYTCIRYFAKTCMLLLSNDVGKSYVD